MTTPAIFRERICATGKSCEVCRTRPAWRCTTAAAYGLASLNACVTGARETVTTDCKSRGLGDTIAKITGALGIRPCGGCAERQAALNKLIPYKDAVQ